MNKNTANPLYEFVEEEKFVSSMSNLKGTLDSLSNDSAVNKVVDANQETEISANTSTNDAQSAEIQAIKQQISAMTVSGVTQEYVDNGLSKKVDKVDGQSLIASGVAEALDLDSENNIESQTGLVVDNYITCEDESGNTHNVGNELASLSGDIASKQDKLEGTINIVGDGMEFISNEGHVKIGDAETGSDFKGVEINEGELTLSGAEIKLNSSEIYVNGTNITDDHTTLLGKEDTVNKVSAITSASTDTEYPSAKAVFDVLKTQTAEIDGDEYINVTKSGTTTEISANIIPFEDAVASAHTITSMTMTQRGETGNIYFLRNEGSDETYDDGEFYAWNFSADPSSISSELYYTKGYPELNVYDDLYVYSGTPVTFTPMRNESGEQMFMVSEYGSVDIEKVDGLLSASDMKGVIGSVGEFYGMTLTDSTSTYHLTYYPNLNFTKDYEYYYGFKFTQEDIEFVVFTKSLNASVGDIVTLYIFKDKQESEEAKSIVDDGDTDVTVISTSATKDSGLYKYINDADNAINVTAEGDTFINAEAENRNVIIHAHTASISKTSDGQLECVMLKYTYLDTSDNKVKTVWGDWVRKSSLDDGKYYAWYMRLQATVDESTAFYTTFIPGESSIGGNIILYKKNDDGEFVESDNFVSAEIIALNNPFINGEYSDTRECKVSKSYGWSSTIGTKTTFHYYQFYTMFEPLKEGEYYVWRGLWCTDEALWYSKDYPTAVGQVIDMYYKEDDEIKLNTGCTYTVTTLTTYSDYNQDGLATAYDVKTYVDNAVSKNEAVIITFPSAQLVDENKVTGSRGETIYEIHVSDESGDTFYTTIGADTTDTCDTYFEKLKTNLVLLYGNVDNYVEASYVEKTTENTITVTWHAHFWQEREDVQYVDLNVADCVCIINFENKEIDFALTQWADDEMHMIHPIRINIDTKFEDARTSAETITMTLQFYDCDTWNSITSKEIINYIKKGYKVEFGIVDTVDGEKVFKVGQYDVYYDTSIKSKSWLMLRWSNFDAGEAVPDTETYYFLNNFSVVVFDESGVCKYNNYSHTPIKGAIYTYNPINSASGDTYVSANVVKNNLGSEYLVKVATNVQSIETATEEKNGLATAYDVKTYVDKEIGDLTTLETSAKTDVVSAINELEGKIITKNMINTLWSMFNICVFNTPDTKAITDTFKSAWGIGVTTKATLLFTSDFNSIYAIDMAEYSDINLSSSIVSGLTPYLAFDEGDEFSFTILIDGVSAYTVNNINGDIFAASLLTDEYIQTLEDEAGASGDFLKLIKQNKGKYCVDCHKLKTVYGYDYDGETYWYKGDEYSSGTETLYSYQNEAEDKKMWLPNKFDETSYGTTVITQYYKYDDPTTSPSLQGDITITIKSTLK